MLRKLAFLVLVLGLLSPLSAQDENPIIGQEAPELTAATSWINADEPITMESLRGQVVVLYFWGVW